MTVQRLLAPALLALAVAGSAAASPAATATAASAGVSSAPASARAAVKLPPLRPYKTDMPPVIDGVLDDAVWKSAPTETGFKTWNPDYGQDMHSATTVYYAYDRENIYFAFRCYDAEPAKVKGSISARDQVRADDWICINLDSFNDQQALYAFYVNPLGIQGDSRFQGGKEDFSVDVVWYSAGRIDAEGYAIEMRIPFKSIRYDSGEPVQMGIIFERHISRFSEGGTYPPLDPAQGPNFSTQTRTLLFEGVRHYTLLEILPAVTYSRDSEADRGALRAGNGQGAFSLTAKYGLTSKLIFDGTINPDFSQVESDAGQVDFNLRYALYYPEKRPFFLEGQDKFNFGASVFGDAVVHTRTIVNPYLGAKLDGKISDKDTVASIYALDELPEGGPGKYAQVGILRYKRSLAQDSYLGAFVTERAESARSNGVAGADGQIRLTPASQLGFHLFASRTRNAGADAAWSHAAGLQYDYQSRDLIINAVVEDLGRDFEIDTGYLTRNGLTRIKVGFMPFIYPKSKLFLRLAPIFNTIQTWDKTSGLSETLNQFDFRAYLPRNSTLLVGGKYATEVFLGRRFGRSSVRIQAASQITKGLYVLVSGNYGEKIRYTDNPYQGRGADAAAKVIVLPTENLNFDLSLTFSNFIRAADGVKEYDYAILRSLNTYQINRYLFVRAIFEYNSFRRTLTTDFLASFTYIPGTVIHVGYGSFYERLAWREDAYAYEPADRLLETRRSFFFKASYLWRM
jgi:hypothetical protein